MSERWRLFQNDRRKDQNGWFEVCWRFLPLVFKFTRERMLVNVAVDIGLRCHISTNSEIAALRLHSSWWCRGTYSGDASEILSSANFCRARDSSGQLWAPRAAKVQSWQSRVAEMQGTRNNSMTRCAISWDESLKKCISSFSPKNLPTQLWDLLRPPSVAAAHCSLEKVPGRTSSKSVLRRAAALWSQETRRPHGILESEQAWIDRNVFSVWLSRNGWMGWSENLTAQHEMSSALCFARQRNTNQSHCMGETRCHVHHDQHSLTIWSWLLCLPGSNYVVQIRDIKNTIKLFQVNFEIQVAAHPSKSPRVLKHLTEGHV